MEEERVFQPPIDAGRNESTELTSDIHSTSEMDIGFTPRKSIESSSQKSFFYKLQLSHMKNEGENTLYIDFVHLYQFNHELASTISDSYYR